MQTVFSHIIQKRFSRSYEDVATDALAFILKSNDAAHKGMMKLLRRIDNNLPDLQFTTQQSEDNIRPDMWGNHENEPHVFIENKFWTGLTDNQPVNYLKKLAEKQHPTILLVIGPEARVHTLWRELQKRLKYAEIFSTDRGNPDGIVYIVTTGTGPILALTTWQKVISVLKDEVTDNSTLSDIHQLRALCEAADIEAFTPLSAHDLTDQRIPALIRHFDTIMQAIFDLGVSEGVLSIKGLMPKSDWNGFGRYARFSNENGVGMWLGVQFELWKKHGGTPLWLDFNNGELSFSHKVRSLLKTWAAKEGIFTSWDDDEFIMAIDIETGEEKDKVVRAIVDRLKEIADVLSTLELKT